MSAQWNSLDIALMTTTDICFSPPPLFCISFHLLFIFNDVWPPTHVSLLARSGERGMRWKIQISLHIYPYPILRISWQSKAIPKIQQSLLCGMLEFLSTELETIYIKLIHFLFEIFTVSNGFPNSSKLEWEEREKCETKVLQQLKCSSRKTSIKSELSEKVFFD